MLPISTTTRTGGKQHKGKQNRYNDIATFDFLDKREKMKKSNARAIKSSPLRSDGIVVGPLLFQ